MSHIEGTGATWNRGGPVVSGEPNDVLDPLLGKVRVLSEKCGTCVFRPGNLMDLAPGRVREIIEHNRRTGAGLTCHQTLPYSQYDAPPAWCRGFVDAYPDTTAVRFALMLIGLTEVDPPAPFVEGTGPAGEGAS
ncbi:hypothetical protein ACFVWN_20475 [Nocardiopsis flavescens]|uniref:hypothetical protein n=1 Tax=Nocardiopsis flavescens TaxID=758803 RepID=UPI0036666C02